ncbi:MAG: DHH family phosphoesterase [Candidatus Bathyarchaeia archaeon]
MNNIKKCIDEFNKIENKVLIVHHDEADGICSAAIIKKALERKGFFIKTLCLDKLFPEVIEKLHSEKDKNIIYTDIGSAHVKRISNVNKSKNFTIILDHHDTEISLDPKVYNINPELYGISGEKEASASTIAYFFAKILDKTNMDLAHLAIIGSAEIPETLIGLNEKALKDALEKKLVEIKKSKFREEIKITSLGKAISYKRISTLLSVLGSVGYYRNGPEIGISICLEGLKPDLEKIALNLENERKLANKRLLTELMNKGLNQLNNVQWFHAMDNFKGMGTKVIGSFCSYLSFQRIVNPNKYLIGIMNMDSTIPKFGKLDKEYVKVSARAPEALSKMIEIGKMPPLSKILPKACEDHGGFGDGHTVAASGIFLKGKEESFLTKLDKLI